MKYVNYHNIKAFKALFSVLGATSYVSHDKIMKDIDDHYAQMLEELGEVDSDECVESFCGIVTQSLNQRGTMRYLYRDDITEALGAWRASKGDRKSLIGNTTTTQEYSTRQEVESQQGEEDDLSQLKAYFKNGDDMKAFVYKSGRLKGKKYVVAPIARIYYECNGRRNMYPEERDELAGILKRLGIIPHKTSPNTIRNNFNK